MTTTSTLTQRAGLSIMLDDDGILIARPADITRETVDALYDVLTTSDREAFEAGRSRRTLVDIRKVGWPTPYSVARIVQSSRVTPVGLRESVAILINPSTLAFRLVENMLRKTTKEAQQITRIFSDEDEAMRWLRSRP